MAETKAARVTIINQKEGRLVLAPDPEELKTNPKAKFREILAGRSLEVSAEEAAILLNHRGVMDASKAIPSHGAQLVKLEKELADAKAENERLNKLVPAAANDAPESGDAEGKGKKKGR